MTQTFSTNTNNDIFLGPDGNLSIRRGLKAVLDACATAAKAQLGEMVFEQNNGIPNFQTIWIGTPNYAIFSSYLRQALENVEGVISVTNLTLSSKNNIFSYTATINTIYGVNTLNG